MPMTRRDRAALSLALECLRSDFNLSRLIAVLRYGRPTSINLWSCALDAYEGHTARRQDRLLRARLALAIRVLLRADAGDYGPTKWEGCRCYCSGDFGGWMPTSYAPLWEGGIPHDATPDQRAWGLAVQRLARWLLTEGT